jgi:hypothetical protein
MYKIAAILMMFFFTTPVFATSRKVVVHNNQYANQVVIEQKVIQFDDFGKLRVIAVPVTSYGPQYYYQAEPLRRPSNISDEDIDKIIQGVVDGVLKQIQVVGDDGGPVQPPVEPEHPTTPPVGQPTSDLDAKVLDLFVNKCITCHIEGTSKGKLTLIKADNSMGVLSDRQISKVVRRAEGGFGLPANKRMPLNAEPLSDEDVQLLKSWEDYRLSQPVAEIQTEETLTNEVP